MSEYRLRKDGTVDPRSIDLDEACRMSGYNPDLHDPDELVTCDMDHLPRVIDFDKLAGLRHPGGYEVVPGSRAVRIVTSSFRGVSVGARHWYCEIRFTGLLLRLEDGAVTMGGPDTGALFGLPRMDVRRRVTPADLLDTRTDWEGYRVGSMTHRWDSERNAVECAKAIVRLRFRNYSEVRVTRL